MKIIPALLADKGSEAGRILELSEKMTPDFLHLDVMDGKLVPSRSLDAGYWRHHPPRLPFAAHLMVEHPLEYLEDFFRAGAFRITFHYESADRPEEVVRRIKAYGLKAGMALNPPTSPEALKPYLPELDYLLVMTVHPGFYGSPFQPEALEKLPLLRNWGENFILGVDGGVNLGTLPLLKRAGAQEANVGSYLFKAQDPLANYRELTQLALEFQEP